MIARYDFDKHIANARNWEARNCTTIRKLSDWNCGRTDPCVPAAQIEAAARAAVADLTTYTETATSLGLGREILGALRALPGASFSEDAALHLYGNATQALFASLYAIRESMTDPKFLLIHPSYYATHDAFAALRIPYIHHWRKLASDGEIDVAELRDLWHEQPFNAILMTDPMYSTGIELSSANFQHTVEFAKEKGLWVVIDSAFCGLTWDDAGRRWLDLPKLQRCGYPKCLVIDSPSKRLFTNNLKLGMVHCSAGVSRHLEKISDSFTGNITGMQYAFAQFIFDPENHVEVRAICDENVRRIVRNYAHLLHVAKDSTKLHFIRPHSGFHTMLFFKGLETGTVDSMEVCAWLVEHGVFALPTNDYYYHDKDPFGFRINLMNAPAKWQDIAARLAATGPQ